MKYCPKCGSLLDGKTTCSCGFEYDEKVVEETLSNNSPITTEFKTGMMIPPKYLKWIFKDSDRPIKMNEVTICDTWDPNNSDWDKRGGFNYSNEQSILRWISRGDTLCEVELPNDAEVLNVNNQKTPNGIFVTNKIILKNPIPVSDELTMELYKKSAMPLKTYFETIAALALRGCTTTAKEIIKDKVNSSNIDEALYEYNNFIKPWHKDHMDKASYDEVLEELLKIKG